MNATTNGGNGPNGVQVAQLRESPSRTGSVTMGTFTLFAGQCNRLGGGFLTPAEAHHRLLNGRKFRAGDELRTDVSDVDLDELNPETRVQWLLRQPMLEQPYPARENGVNVRGRKAEGFAVSVEDILMKIILLTLLNYVMNDG